jgi:hypothetical protein
MSTLTAILQICTLLFLIVNGSSAVIIPAPDADSHAYKVAVAHFPLTDIAYRDPYVATQNRKLMASLFLPVSNTLCTQECESTYMPPTTARILSRQFFSNANTTIFNTTTYSTCCRTSQLIDAAAYPLVVLEPQVRTSRLLYSTLARHITANGAAVILIDHPYDASIVEFAYSRAIYNNGSIDLSAFNPVQTWNGTVTQAVETRMRDVRFVLAQLGDVASLRRQFPEMEFESAFRVDGYAVVGHGLGGATATTLSVLDSRVRFSINMAGSAPLLRHPVEASRYELLRALLVRRAGWWLDMSLKSLSEACVPSAAC